MIFAVFLSVAINTAVALFHNSRKFCTSLSYHNFFCFKDGSHHHHGFSKICNFDVQSALGLNDYGSTAILQLFKLAALHLLDTYLDHP